MSGKEICLVLVYNHRFDSNIDKLEQVYRGKFDDIFHLIPFYEGDKQNVIPVYESSHYFQGYFAQSYRQLEDERYSHYVFIADDLILNSRLNSANLLDELKLDVNTGYIKSVEALSDSSFEWEYFQPAVSTWFWARRNGSLDYYLRQLPPKGEATARFEAHGIKMQEISWNHLNWKNRRFNYESNRVFRAAAFLFNHRHDRSLPYPLAAGYADLIIVPRAALKKFAHLCGVFAAMNLWVEVAVPTAMLLACERLVYEANTAWRGIELWSSAEVDSLLERNNFDLKKILDSYPKHQLYVHPIKLSRWKTIEL